MSVWDDRLRGRADVGEVLGEGGFDRPTLAEWTRERLAWTEETRADVIRRSSMSPAHAYQIMQGTRVGSRDKLVRLAFGWQLGPDEASRMIEVGGANALDPTSRRDTIVAWCLAHGLDVHQANDLLWRNGERPLE